MGVQNHRLNERIFSLSSRAGPTYPPPQPAASGVNKSSTSMVGTTTAPTLCPGSASSSFLTRCPSNLTPQLRGGAALSSILIAPQQALEVIDPARGWEEVIYPLGARFLIGGVTVILKNAARGVAKLTSPSISPISKFLESSLNLTALSTFRGLRKPRRGDL